jgi:hypothetical protein
LRQAVHRQLAPSREILATRRFLGRPNALPTVNLIVFTGFAQACNLKAPLSVLKGAGLRRCGCGRTDRRCVTNVYLATLGN